MDNKFEQTSEKKFYRVIGKNGVKCKESEDQNHFEYMDVMGNTVAKANFSDKIYLINVTVLQGTLK